MRSRIGHAWVTVAIIAGSLAVGPAGQVAAASSKSSGPTCTTVKPTTSTTIASTTTTTVPGRGSGSGAQHGGGPGPALYSRLPSRRGRLAFTGTNALTLLVVAVDLLGIGVFVVMLGRRPPQR